MLQPRPHRATYEWDGADRRYFSEHSMALQLADNEEVSITELTAAYSDQLTRTVLRNSSTTRGVTGG